MTVILIITAKIVTWIDRGKILYHSLNHLKMEEYEEGMMTISICRVVLSAISMSMR